MKTLLPGKNGGAAQNVRRWWYQRLSAVALLPLILWFIYDLAGLASLEYAAVREWLAAPSTVVLLILLVPVLFYHSQVGLEEVIEDYVAAERRKSAAITLTRFLSTLCALVSVLSVTAVISGY